LILDNHKVYHSSDENNKHIYVVGLILSTQIARPLYTNFRLVSERIIEIQLNGNPMNINIEQVYAPTTDASDNLNR